MDKKNVEVIFPLSPMQRGMLLHALHAQGEDPGALHLRCTLTGNLDLDAFRHAVAHVTQRHPVLRTIVRWKGLDEPLQIVLRTAEVSITVEDLRGVDEARQQAHLDAYREADLERGIDLSKPPTSRIALFQTSDMAWRLIWSCHHALLDGWSGALLLREVVTVTNACQRNAPVELASAPPFQDYVRWLRRQPEEEAEAFWTNELAGLSHPTPLPLLPVEAGRRIEAASARIEQVSIEVSEATTTRLREMARQNQVTLSAVLHGVWGIVLSGLSGEPAVVFGSTTSGRGIDLPGVEDMAGTLINTLPVRVEVPEGSSALDVCRQVHASQSGRDRFSYSDPAQIQGWSEVPPHQRLYETLLVVENYPASMDEAGPVRVEDLAGGITSAFPLTVIAIPDDGLRLHLVADTRRIGVQAAEQILAHLVRLLDRLPESPNAPARELVKGLGQATGAVHAPVPSPSARIGREKPLDTAQTLVEQTLVDIWEAVLQVSPISVTDSFFELGGTSVMTAQVMARAQAAGLEIKTGDFFAHPTIRELAGALAAPAATEQYLVPLAPSGTKAPLFIVHGWGGKLFEYLELARQLGEDQPVYGLQDVDREDSGNGFSSLEEMAERYAEEILARQPEGPIHLLGFSAGGTIAYAVAAHLHRSGVKVGTLFILDTFPPNLPPYVHVRVIQPRLLQRAKHHARSMIASPQKALGTVLRLIQTARTEFSVPSESSRPLNPVEPLPGEDAYVALRRHYVPTPCPISIVLVESCRTQEQLNLGLAWRHLVGDDVEVHRVEAEDHLTVLREPRQNGVARIIQDRLAQASSGDRG